MKRKLLPLLIAGLTVASANVALAGVPTVYGKVNVTLNKYELEKVNSATGFTGAAGSSYTNQDDWKMESNASRLGVKGDVDLSGSLKAVYKLEYEVITTADKEGDNGSDFKQRNTYAGLQSADWGTLVFGRNDTPVKLIRTDVEAYHDMPIADVSNVLVGENRLNNMVMYTSPSFSGFAVTLMAAPGEQSGKPTTAAPAATTNNPTQAAYKHGKEDNGIFDSASAAVTWTASNAFVGVAYENNIANVDTIEVTGQYSFGPVKLGAAWQKAEENIKGDGIQASSIKGDSWSDHLASTANTGADRLKKQDGYLVNVQWAVTKEIALKAQYAHSTNEHVVNAINSTDVKLGDTKLNQIALGADYKLSDASKVFAYYAQVKAEGELVSFANPDDTTDKTFAVGYELKF